MPIDTAPAAYEHVRALPGLSIQGIAVHIGSQLTDLAPLDAANRKVGAVIGGLRGAGDIITHADLGGGLGVPYDRSMPTPQAYGAMVAAIVRDWDVRPIVEPGRLVVANAGVLLSRVIRIKPSLPDPFVHIDAAMNDLIRPALYYAHHEVDPVNSTGDNLIGNVVGLFARPATPSPPVAAWAGSRRLYDRLPHRHRVRRDRGSPYDSRPLTAEVIVRGRDERCRAGVRTSRR